MKYLFYTQMFAFQCFCTTAPLYSGSCVYHHVGMRRPVANRNVVILVSNRRYAISNHNADSVIISCCINRITEISFCFITNNQTKFKGDDVIKWQHFPRHWRFVRGIHRSSVNSPHKGQWRRALVLSLICVWTNGCAQQGSRWFETLPRSLWRHSNASARWVLYHWRVRRQRSESGPAADYILWPVLLTEPIV